MKKVLCFLLVALVAGFGSLGCEVGDVSGSNQVDELLAVEDYSEAVTSSGFTETFESGTKTSYTAAAVTLSSGSWYFTDAIIGTSSYDTKSGTQSARIRNTGKVTMKFDLTAGAGTVAVAHALYGSDASTTWELYKSADAGSTWIKVGSTVTTSSTTLSTQTFTVNQSGNIRFEIRKASGTGRMNIDDIAVTAYSSTSSDTGAGTGTDSGSTTTTGLADNDAMLMGNPSGAVASTSYPNNYLMVKPTYSIAYSNAKKTPIWVSWHLSSSDLGSASRTSSFSSDSSLPSSWYKVTTSDYTGSGFSRGHMCPSADRTISSTVNASVFVMTNMIPQCQTNNGGAWEGLETYERNLVSSGSYELYIICGPAGKGGYTTSTNVYTETFGSSSNPITVPKSTWKIIVVLPVGTGDLSRITASTRVIAVNMPNDNTCGGSSTWGNYRVSVDALETLTGFDFLSNVSTSVQSALESKVDTGATN